ncbi:dentin sialophosphoprotein-like [Cyclopterus lumpus]|uniref:Ig-like domain-containing protein n=1 Tax=Cyclopterus lumpus TaxID=8103 RepID=A0A8C3G3F1_CYCLU|nr:dentin sialophosphoprotein-like [Cyclopterus lumpus]
MAARYFLFYFIFIPSCLVAGQPSQYALKGGRGFLRPDIAGHPDGILWKYNGNKVVEFNGKEQEVFSPYEHRITLDWVSAELDISDVRFEDSGDYELEVDIRKVLHRSFHKLEVIDTVPKPTISCEMNDGGSSNVSGELLCSAEPRQPQSFMTFEWRTHGDVWPGPRLPISLGDAYDDEVYSCSVSNLLSREEATFPAKDCYPDESSSVILIACLVVAFLLACLLVCLAILYCKLRHKACFAKHDLENPSPPGRTEGSDRKEAQNAERRPLVHRESTLPSTQPLGRFFRGNMRPDESARDQKQDPDSDHDTEQEHEENEEDGKPKEGDADAGAHGESPEEDVPQSDPSDSEKDNEPDPAHARVSDHFSEDTQLEPKLPSSSEHPSHNTEPEREADEDEEAQSAPADDETSPAAQPHSPLTETSANMAPKDTAGEDEEVANSDPIAGESAETHVRGSDSSGEGDRKGSDDSGEDEQLSTGGSKTLLHDLNLSQEETNTSKDNERETVEPVSEDKDKRKTDGVSESDRDLYSATSRHPQSSTPTQPDNRNTDTCPESPDSAHAPPDEGEDLKTCTDSDETDGQSDEGEGETAEDQNEVQCGLQGEKHVNESCSGDAVGRKKEEVVA